MSSKVFKKAVLVEHSNQEIFAIAEDSALYLLGLDLETKAVIGNCLPGKINCLRVTDRYISYGGFNNLVMVLSRDGQLSLVSAKIATNLPVILGVLPIWRHID